MLAHHHPGVLSGSHGVLHVAAEGVHDAHHGVKDHVVRVGALDLVALIQLARRSVVNVGQAEGAQRVVGLNKKKKRSFVGVGGMGKGKLCWQMI